MYDKPMQQYKCPQCGAVGAHPKDSYRPKCHKPSCNYEITMRKSHNGKFTETDCLDCEPERDYQCGFCYAMENDLEY